MTKPPCLVLVAGPVMVVLRVTNTSMANDTTAIERCQYDHMKQSSAPDSLAVALRALGEPRRLAIVRQLAREGRVCACDFDACCTVGQPTVSHHVKVLREARVIQGQKEGRWVWYRLDPVGLELVQDLMSDLLQAATSVATPK